VLWDPCCGSGYLLAVLGLLHRRHISSVLASDLDPAALALAERNLRLLTDAGLADRAAELHRRSERFDKPSYAEAARSAWRLAGELEAAGGDVPYRVCEADGLDPAQLRRVVDGLAPDIVIVDVPYGERVHWLGPAASHGVAGLVSAVSSVVPDDCVIAVTTRGRKLSVDGGVARRASFRIGTRTVTLFQKS
jgi:23S rRNA G2445 N2-methylase RlmL